MARPLARLCEKSRAAMVPGAKRLAGLTMSETAVRADSLLVAHDRLYLDYGEMARREAERSEGIDVVVIATPPQIHAVVAEAFLRAGIDVICEKPLTRTLAEALHLKQVVDVSGCVFVLTHCYSRFPMVRHARDLVASGALGQIRIIESESQEARPA